MKYKLKISVAFVLLSALLCLSLSGCSQPASSSLQSKTGESSTVSKSTEEQRLDEHFFPKDKIVDVMLTIEADDFQQMLDNPTAEQYVAASVNYNGKIYDNIAIRTKGNSSLSSVAGMADSDRYSFKLSLDEYVSQHMEGITKINLNNNFSDASYMREFLAYEIADSMGIATPKFSFVNVYINDELWGLYTAVEQFGPAFLKREFNDTSGTLYKSNGGAGADLSLLDSFSDYSGLDVKSGQANEQALLKMTAQLNSGNINEDVLDIEAALKFIALNTVTVNMDSYAGNFQHNYYMYEQNGKFTIIPWDLNMAFGGFGGEGILIDEPTGVALASRPLINKLLENDEYKERYHEIIAEMIEQSFANEQFSQRVAELKTLIADAVKADPTAFVTYEQFEAGVTSLISFADAQTASFTKQLNGEIASAGDGTGSASRGGGFGGGFGGEDFGGAGFGGGQRQPLEQQAMQNDAAMPQANGDFMAPNGAANMPPIDGGFVGPNGAGNLPQADSNFMEQNPQDRNMMGAGNGENRFNGNGMPPGGGGRGMNPFMQAGTNSFNEAEAKQQFTMTSISLLALAAAITIVHFWRRKRL